MIKIILKPIFFITLFYSVLTATPPEWFHKLHHNEFEIIGYGSSKNLEEARNIAKKEIANSIQTLIKTETISQTKEKNNKVNENIETYIEVKTNVVLSDLINLKEEQINKIWFVAFKYFNLPLEKKFASKISEQISNEKQNKYLRKTPLFKSLNNELKYQLDIKLKRKDNLWYLSYNKIMLPLSPNDFEKFFISSQSDIVQINSSPSRLLYEGDVFHFNILASENGYISIINVYENGVCFVISSNQKIKSNKIITIPDEFSDKELVAGLFNENQNTFDLYIALFSKEKINLSRFQKANDTIKTGEYYFKFDEILEMMNYYEFSTVLIRTEPQK